MQFSKGMLHDLKSVSLLSSRKDWEYAGKLDIQQKKGKLVYKGITYHTSERNDGVDADVIKVAWDGPLTYHTHPCPMEGFHTSLPSDADFKTYIMGHPRLWTNLVCDRDGFYVVRLTDPTALPLPHVVQDTLTDMRTEPFLWTRRVNHDGREYFKTNPEEWKEFVNHDMHPRLMDRFGISLEYWDYN
jgi:hypothetical protein